MGLRPIEFMVEPKVPDNVTLPELRPLRRGTAPWTQGEVHRLPTCTYVTKGTVWSRRQDSKEKHRIGRSTRVFGRWAERIVIVLELLIIYRHRVSPQRREPCILLLLLFPLIFLNFILCLESFPRSLSNIINHSSFFPRTLSSPPKRFERAVSPELVRDRAN